MKNLRHEMGFSLIEVLVVVAIIGILAAIALPQFARYRNRGFEATLQSDLKNAASAEEAYFAQNQVYKAGALSAAILPGYNKTLEISIASTVGTNTFMLTATHSNCSGVTWSYQNVIGVASGPSCP